VVQIGHVSLLAFHQDLFGFTQRSVKAIIFISNMMKMLLGKFSVYECILSCLLV
jgi:hypothetical protein